MKQLLDVEGKAPAPKVLIAVPSGDQVAAGFAHDLAHLMAATALNAPGVNLRLAFNHGTLLPSMRTRLVYDAIAQKCSHILWLDSDMRFPPWALVQLLSHREPVVGCNYPTRRHPLRPTAFKDIEKPGERLYTEPGAAGLEAVAGIGFGCALIDVDVFTFLPQPWFNVEWFEKETPAGIEGGFIGEDLFFCNKLRTAQIPVLVDQDLSQHIRHVGSWDYSHDHALVQRDAMHAEGPARDLQLHDPSVGS